MHLPILRRLPRLPERANGLRRAFRCPPLSNITQSNNAILPQLFLLAAAFFFGVGRLGVYANLEAAKRLFRLKKLGVLAWLDLASIPIHRRSRLDRFFQLRQHVSRQRR